MLVNEWHSQGIDHLQQYNNLDFSGIFGEILGLCMSSDKLLFDIFGYTGNANLKIYPSPPRCKIFDTNPVSTPECLNLTIQDRFMRRFHLLRKLFVICYIWFNICYGTTT